MHYKDRIDREQIMMLSYDTMVSADNPSRLIDLLCKKFIADNPLRCEWKGNKKTGRKSYPPSSMLSLLVYGYFNGISSSRKMERETYRNIEVVWLMEGLQPDHWTICEFRRDNEKLIKEMLKMFRRFLLDSSYASGDNLVFDGTKVKAYARRDMLNMEGVRTKLENIDKSIEQYLSQLENNDCQNNELEATREENELLKKKIAKLEGKKSRLESAEQVLVESGKKYISPNDKDAVLVKGREGKFAGYNAQIGVEDKGHFIMTDEVTTQPNDRRQLKGLVDKVVEEVGVTPKEILADMGYDNTTQILEIESQNIQCYVPLVETKREKEEKNGIVFKYDKQSDTYICSQGKKLKLHAKNVKQSGATYNVYKCHECQGCPIKDKCTTSKTGRIVKRNINQEDIDKYKERLKSNYSKERIKQRKTIVEHPFGTIKWLMGKFNFLLKGEEKAQIEFDLYTTAYNIKRLMNCSTTNEIMGKIMKYDWKLA